MLLMRLPDGSKYFNMDLLVEAEVRDDRLFLRFAAPVFPTLAGLDECVEGHEVELCGRNAAYATHWLHHAHWVDATEADVVPDRTAVTPPVAAFTAPETEDGAASCPSCRDSPVPGVIFHLDQPLSQPAPYLKACRQCGLFRTDAEAARAAGAFFDRVVRHNRNGDFYLGNLLDRPQA